MILRNFCLKTIQGARAYSSQIGRLWDRGFINDVFPDNAQSVNFSLIIPLIKLVSFRSQIKQKFANSSQSIYAGFDPSAESLHVGNLLVIMGLMHFQRDGHQPIALLGGATGQIGDPSGRNTERNLLETDVMSKNLENIRSQIGRLFDNHSNYFRNSTTAGNNWRDLK